jgi:amino acid adenylation domain-containing protein
MNDQRQTLSSPAGGNAMRDPSWAGLHYLIEQVVERRPEAVALRCGGEALSYAELNRRANECAHYLRDLGVGPDVLVGVLMERSVELVVALLAILKAGGAYLPLATDYPAERLDFLARDSGISLVLTRAESAPLLAGLGITGLRLDAERELFAGMSGENPAAITGPGELAYVIYTSGSTGQPKGCLIEHAAICNRLLWMRDHYGISEADRILQKTPYTFDVSVWEFFLPLISGATLVLAKPGGHKDNRYLKELIQTERVTACHFVPSMLRFFLRQDGVAGCDTLRNVFVSGEALPYGLMTQCLATLPAQLHNLYGPTEVAVDVTYWACAERPDQKVPIGRAISNVAIYLLDGQLQPVPNGEAGELYLGGIGVGRGYLNRPELTRERFVKDPFSADAKARLYRTGDQARVLADGLVEYLGRLDFQVKVRGFRIELSEIEAALRGHEGIEDAVVLVRDADSDDPKLVAYVSFRQAPLGIKEVRDFIKRKLPEYMAPNRVVALKEFPVTANGKLDRAALPWPITEARTVPAAPSRVETDAGLAPAVAKPAPETRSQPRHAAEKVFTELADAEIAADLRGLFQRALGVESLAETGDLFDLGATSFTMVQAVDYIQTQYGVAVPVDLFFDSPTIQAIAAYVQQRTDKPAVAPRSCACGDGAEASAARQTTSPIPLAAADFKDEAYLRGAAARQFSDQPASLGALGQLLSLLRRHPGRPGPKYLYSSAGGLRAVQTYLYVRDRGVEGLAEGCYYYHPEEHRLYALKPGHRIESTVFCAGDRAAFTQAGFALFLIAQMDAIQLMYSNASPVLVAVEAGYMAQALMEHHAAFGLGLRPAGGVAVESIQAGFQLASSHRFLHCLIGGAASETQLTGEAGTLVDLLKARGVGPHAHDPRYHGDRTFAHFLRAENIGDGLPTPDQKEELHRQQLHVRRFAPGAKTVDLPAWEAEAGYYALRTAKRTYREGPVSFGHFSGFLALLAANPRPVGARFLHASVIAPHALKVFVYVKDGGVENVPEGLYRYDGERRELRLITRALSADLKSCYTPFNRKHYQLAKFCLFLASPAEALKPVLGEDGTFFALLESGYVGQLLLDRQAEFELGVCPIGGMRYEKIRDDFQLAAADVFLHSFVGGEVAPECAIPWEPLEMARAGQAEPVSARRKTQPAIREPLLQSAPARRAIAVVGLSGRFPEATDLSAFARNLKAGKNSFKELNFDPAGAYRGGRETPAGSPTTRHWGGFLEDVDCFDSILFQITPAEARTIDPQERLMLESAWECLENSGYTGAELNRMAAEVGVFIGAMWDDYQHFQPETWPPVRAGEAISAQHASIANRLSFFFDFKGPSVAVNTSCSSAMTALHLGCQSLLNGECRAALVGGVNLMTHPYHQWVLTAAELLSEDGVCRPFGLKANGWVAGEGVGAVLLKPLDDAVSDRDTIHGVILGTTIAHSGRTGRYGAPSSTRQAESMRAALAKAGLSAGDIGYVEAAAPGAGMADAAEAAAIKEVFGAAGPVVHVGSVKANIGHLESASAMSQLAKVLLQLRHGQIFPTLQFSPINPLVQWQGTALRIPDAVVPWPAGGGTSPRRALINAFGATGSGGHLVVEEYPAPEWPDRETETLIVLSAASKEQLRTAARRLGEYLRQPEAAVARIADIGFTLRAGREPMKARLAVVVASRRELRERLEAFLAGAQSPELCLGEAVGPASGEEQLPDANPRAVAAKWVTGACGLGRGKEDASARRVPLPTYPFAKDRYWVGVSAETRACPPVAASDALRPRVEDYLEDLFSKVTEIPRDRIDARARFDAYGMTSLMVKRLSARLAEDFGQLNPALLFERQTIGELAGYFLSRQPRTLQKLFPPTSAACAQPAPSEATKMEPVSPVAVAPRPGPATVEEPLAIVGVSGRYPQSPNLPAFWENLKNGVDCISEIPASRWDDARLQAEAGPHSRWGGFLDGVDEFDPLFFKISPREAQEMDPQERLFLQTVWHLFEDAGCVPAELSRRTRGRIGVFVGVMYGEYQLHSRWNEPAGEGLPVTSLYGSIANRVSYGFDFHGPSMAVDTLCSSSLTALHLAAQSLRAGECEAAIVGGVNVSIHPNKYLLHARAAMSSSDGRCRSFGRGGDGFVPGEGVGAVLVKPLAAALRDGDPIYAVIRATAINQDGKTHGYTVPNPNAQAALVSEAIRKSGVDPRRISYVEAHGTGTSLGDPIEILGLARAFNEYTADTQYCALGSVKSNIGHLESAAGMAGLTKILLQMRHGKLAPSLHSRELNPDIQFEKTPFFVPQTLTDWERPRVKKDGVERQVPRLACISSFGAGGSNAHAIIEEYDAGPGAESTVKEPQLIVLSARDADRLREVAARWRDFARQNPAVSLTEAAYTLQMGREAMAERLAFVAVSFAEVAATLQTFLDGGKDSRALYRGTIDRQPSNLQSLLEDEALQGAVNQWLDNRKFDRILKAWVEGVKVDWRRLHPGAPPRKVSLPNYPFARERYWVPQRAGGAAGLASPAAWLHPLLQRNTSDLWKLRFSSTFDGGEFFFRDHRLRGERVLPAAACLELARAAVEQAAPGAAGLIRLSNVVWAKPFTVSQRSRSIHVGLRADERGGIQFELYADEPPAPKVIISQGSASFGPAEALPQVDLKGLRERLQRTDLSPARCHEVFRSFGLEHGPAFLSLREIFRGAEGALARVAIPPSVADTRESFALHPALLDGLFQATLALGDAGVNSRPGIPYALDELVCYRACAEEMWACLRPATGPGGKLDLDLCDASGAVYVRIRGFSTRVIESESAPRPRLSRPVMRDGSLSKNGTPHIWARHCVALCGVDPAIALDLATARNDVTWVSLQPGDGDPAARFEAAAVQLFELVQRLLSGKTAGNTILQVLVSAAAADRVYRGLNGLLLTARQENPAFTGQVIELSARPDAAAILGVVAENQAHPKDSHITYEGNRRMVAAWEPFSAVTPVVCPWKNRGVYLITGGAGGLGRWFASEIARKTEACAIHLAGRSALTPEGEGWLRALERPGVVARYHRVDVTAGDAVRAWVREVVKEHGALAGILHAAGVARDNFILKKTTGEWREVLAPKLQGAVHLDEATRDMNLDFFALFSSTAGALGNAGQADYAAANGFLDAFAEYRNALAREGKRQGRTLSVNWPLWKEGGMKAPAELLKLLAAESGVEPLETNDGLEAFAQALASGASRVLVEVCSREPVRAPLPTPEPRASVQAATATAVASGPLPDRTIRFFRELLASTIQSPVERVKVDEPFDSYGIDSVMVMRMTNELEKSFGSLSKTLFFEHHTIRSLAGYFLEAHRATLLRLFAERSAVAAPAAVENLPARPPAMPACRPVSAPGRCLGAPSEALDIAIVGLAGRYPQANDLAAFWSNLSQGRDCVTEFPAGRKAWRAGNVADPNGAVAPHLMRGGFLDDVDAFDPLFFNIAPRDARYLDPQERLFLETSWAALEDAGYCPRDLRGAPGPYLPAQVGVYAGVMYSEYQLFAHEQTLAGSPVVAGNIYASIANRVSYFLDLHGPSITIDTMCSSSLTGIYLACQDLKSGRTDLALAGGVNVTIHPNKFLLLSEGQFISQKGCCGSFGREGDGYVPGEGVGAVVLKRLADAQRDGDHIYAVIKGAAVNHGGKTNGFTVPNPDAQCEVIARAMEMGGVDPARVTYIEAHSTGTPLGDPIEIAGLTKAFKRARGAVDRCFLGSVKSNLGHCEAAAGIAGLTKILLQMKHGQLAPSLHSEVLNPSLNLESTPFQVNQTLRPWERRMVAGRPEPYVAGISGFGAGGSNAHLIVEEYLEPPPPASEQARESWVIALSARNEKRLRESAARLQRFLKASPAFALAEVAYTLQVGRLPMEERLGFTASSADELIELLGQAARGVANGKIRRGRVADGAAETLRALAEDDDLNLDAAMERWASQGKQEKLIDLWVGGLDIDWGGFYGAARPRRMSLPTYPFARDRYWLPKTDPAPPASAASYPRAADPAASPQVADEWLAVKEEWTPEPWAEPMDWDARIRRQAGRRITLLVAEAAEGREFQRLITDWEAAAGVVSGVIVDVVPFANLDAWRLAPPPEVVLIAAPYGGGEEADQRHVAALFQVVQKLMREAWEVPIRIYHVHDSSEAQPRLQLESLGGLLRSAMLENEHHVWTCVAIPSGASADARRQTLLREWLADERIEGFAALRHRGPERSRHRLVEPPARSGGESVFRERGTYVIAGGLGPIGEQLCGELARRYQARLVLFSRGEFDGRKSEQCRRLEDLGARVSYYQADVADRSALAAAWQTMKSETGAIHGVIHLARSVEDGLILSKSWTVFARVIRAKVDGTRNLDELSAAEPLDFFLLFSSMSAFGVRGSSDYGYSSAFQNAYAGYRAQLAARGARSGKSLACAWGPWAVDKYQPEQRNARAREAGYRLIKLEQAFPWLESQGWRGDACLGLMLVHEREKVRRQWGLVEPEAGTHALSGILETRLEEWEQWQRDGRSITAAEVSGVLRADQVARLTPALTHRLHALLTRSGNGRPVEKPAARATTDGSETGDLTMGIKRCLADILDLTEVSDAKPFQEYGMDSISGLRFALLMEKRLKLQVRPQWLMEHPTVRALAAHLASAGETAVETREGG